MCFIGRPLPRLCWGSLIINMLSATRWQFDKTPQKWCICVSSAMKLVCSVLWIHCGLQRHSGIYTPLQFILQDDSGKHISSIWLSEETIGMSVLCCKMVTLDVSIARRILCTGGKIAETEVIHLFVDMVEQQKRPVVSEWAVSRAAF